MKKVLVLALIMSLFPIIKQHNINGRIITIHHNDVIDIMPMSSKATIYDYGSAKTLVVDNNIIFSNVNDYSVE